VVSRVFMYCKDGAGSWYLVMVNVAMMGEGFVRDSCQDV